MIKKTMAAVGLCLAMSFGGVALADDAYTLKADQKMSSVLRDFAGKRVTVHLRAGGELTGKVAVIGDHVVQLSQLAGKDFYDAVVALDAIEAVELKVR